jgi:hypothetical protein
MKVGAVTDGEKEVGEQSGDKSPTKEELENDVELANVREKARNDMHVSHTFRSILKIG